jgi:hypothetical protein
MKCVLCAKWQRKFRLEFWVAQKGGETRRKKKADESAVALSKWAANSRLNGAHPCYFVRSQWFLFNIRDICSFVLTLSAFLLHRRGHNGMGVSAPKKESKKKALFR